MVTKKWTFFELLVWICEKESVDKTERGGGKIGTGQKKGQPRGARVNGKRRGTDQSLKWVSS